MLSRWFSSKVINELLTILLICSAFVFIAELLLSLQWRMELDSPMYYYAALLVSKFGYVPYKDFFEICMVGTILYHILIAKLFGYSDLAFRLVDISWLLMYLIIIWFTMRPFEKQIALAAGLIFAFIYLGFGPIISLQREYIAMLPIALSMLLISQFTLINSKIKVLVIGGLFALSALIKPHLIIGLPVMLIYLVKKIQNEEPKLKYIIKYGAYLTIGFFTIFLLPYIWLWKIGGLQSFWDIFINYLPLYLQFTGDFRILSLSNQLFYRGLSYLKFGGLPTQFIFGCFWVLIALRLTFKKLHKMVYLIFTLMLTYSIYPIISGQFWSYHWIPFYYFSSLSAALVLLPILKNFNLHRKVISLFMFIRDSRHIGFIYWI